MKTKFLTIAVLILASITLSSTNLSAMPAAPKKGGGTSKNTLPSEASAYGKYSTLLQILQCRQDKAQYGNYTDYGYWKGGAWCGQQGVAGYWVWVNPNWYVWKYQK